MSRSEYIKLGLKKLQEKYPETNSYSSTDFSIWFECEKFDFSCHAHVVAKIMKKVSKLLKHTDEELSQKELAFLLRKKYPHIYAITATPSDPQRTKHEIGYFKSQEQAEEKLVSKTQDWNDVVWTYHIDVKNSEDISDWNITHLGLVHPEYPYK